jgi:hypothetical protein
VTDRRAGSVGLNVEIVAAPPVRQVGGDALNVDVQATAPARRVGSVVLNVDVQATAPARQVGSVALNVEITPGIGRQVGGVGLQPDIVTTAPRQIGGVALQIDRYPPAALVGGAGISVEFARPATGYPQVGAAGVSVDFYVPPQLLGRSVPATAQFGGQRLSRNVVALAQFSGLFPPWIRATAPTAAASLDTAAVVVAVTDASAAQRWWYGAISTNSRSVPATALLSTVVSNFRSVPITASFSAGPLRQVGAFGFVVDYQPTPPQRQLGGFGFVVDFASPPPARQLGSFGFLVDYRPVATRVVPVTVVFATPPTPRRIGSFALNVEVRAVPSRRIGSFALNVEALPRPQIERSVPGTAWFLPARERPVPVYPAFRWHQQRSVPARFIAHWDRYIPVTACFGGTRRSRSVPATGQIVQPTPHALTVPLQLWVKTYATPRSVPARTQLYRAGWIPIQAVFTSLRTVVPLRIPVQVETNLPVPLSIPVGFTRPSQDVPVLARFVRRPDRAVPLTLIVKGRGSGRAGEWVVAVGRLLLTSTFTVPLSIPVGDTRPGIHVTQMFLDVLTTHEDELAVTQFVIEVIAPRLQPTPYGQMVG